jgi:hypothetical protein
MLTRLIKTTSRAGPQVDDFSGKYKLVNQCRHRDTKASRRDIPRGLRIGPQIDVSVLKVEVRKSMPPHGNARTSFEKDTAEVKHLKYAL